MAAQLMKLNAMRADPREGSRLDAGPNAENDSRSGQIRNSETTPRWGVP
jgi:hypothetical protein